MPINLYGPGDSHYPEFSHVTPALIRRFYQASVSNALEVVIWGTCPEGENFYILMI